ncbi:MAG: hypothetical protein Q7U30_03045, partial [Methylicorpusculum sp.]|nr:hypothetical protein [Methylicorpusculum sp.]
CQHGCWHRAYMDVITASFDGHPDAEFRSTMGILPKISNDWMHFNRAGYQQIPAYALRFQTSDRTQVYE